MWPQTPAGRFWSAFRSDAILAKPWHGSARHEVSPHILLPVWGSKPEPDKIHRDCWNRYPERWAARATAHFHAGPPAKCAGWNTSNSHRGPTSLPPFSFPYPSFQITFAHSDWNLIQFLLHLQHHKIILILAAFAYQLCHMPGKPLPQGPHTCKNGPKTRISIKTYFTLVHGLSPRNRGETPKFVLNLFCFKNVKTNSFVLR